MQPSPPWSKLEANIRGRLMLPDSAGYDMARRVWNGAIDRRPAAILVCSRPADAVAGVRFAAAAELKVCVRGGGHNVAGRAVQDGRLLIDLSAMRDVRVDARAQRVDAAGGATLREMDHATGLFGLATTGGMVSDTGIGGLTLGGGIGWLMRRHGLTIDNLQSASVVLADGRELEASATQNTDLFWALRGGGGHVGVITRFTYRLHAISTVLGGPLWYHAERAPEVLRALRAVNDSAPDELTTVAVAAIAPPDPSLPESLRGKPALVVVLCWCGDIAAGERVLAPLRASHPADFDRVGPIPYPALQSSLDPSAPRGLHNWWESRYVQRLDDASLDWFAVQALKLPTPFSAIHCHLLGGAVGRGDVNDAAAGIRRSAYVINAIGVSDRPGQLDSLAAWSRQCTEGFSAKTEHTYVNFSSADSAFPNQVFETGVRQRLQAIKRRYDPSDLFA